MNRTFAESAIILAPHGRDADIAQAMLQEARLESRTTTDLPGFVAALRAGAGFAILAEEALRGADLNALVSTLAEQAEWSDLPFIVLTQRGGGLERNPGAVRLLETLGNVTFLERPFHPTTLVSLARAARRARLKQYEARKRLEEIQEGQKQLRLALAAGGLGAWIINLDPLELEADRDCKAHFGRRDDEAFSYRALLDSIHHDDRVAVREAAAKTIATGEDYNIDYRCIWPDGTTHWVQTSGRIESDSSGQPVRLVGVTHEITARREAEARQAALLKLGDGLRQLKDPADMSFFAAQIIGETMGVSRAGYGTIDPVRETITIERDWNTSGTASIAGTLQFRDYGSYIEDLKAGRTAAISDVREDARTAESAGELERISARAFVNMPITEDGAFVALLFLNHDQPRLWPTEDLVFIRDVADRVRAAVERRNVEISLAALAETLERKVEERTQERDGTWRNSQDLLAIISAPGNLVAVNPAWTSVLGWDPEEVIDQDIFAFVHPDDREASGRAHRIALNEPLRQHENRMRHKDGSYRWISWVAATIGERIYASGRHVTAEREAKAELETAQEQLRQAQKMEAVGQLTGGLAHDFNNLLTAISGSLELTQTRLQQGRTDGLDRYISMAQQGARRAAALTHRLLAFSRRQTLDPRPTNINRLINGLDDLLRRTVGPGIEVEIVGAGGLWTTSIDANQLENALLNLCINARDAMPDGGRITIETANTWLDFATARQRDLQPGQYVSLSVTDTGSGMDAETIERAFDPFFTTKPLGEGTGLGLSMIYGFVRQSGGQVRIYSELGQGTTMCLYFPRSMAAAEEDAPGNRADPSQMSNDGETVLVVDDEPAVRGLIIEVLGELGYTTVEAADGPGGLAILTSDQRIDLLITDVGLPKGMNGRQLADAARTGRPELKILFITGYAENAVVGNGHLEPGMHVMTKPFPMEAFATRVQELIAA